LARRGQAVSVSQSLNPQILKSLNPEISLSLKDSHNFALSNDLAFHRLEERCLIEPFLHVEWRAQRINGEVIVMGRAGRWRRAAIARFEWWRARTLECVEP